MKGRVEVVQGKGREAPNHLEGQESQTAHGSANNPTLLLQWGCGGREGRWEGGRGQSSDDLDATEGLGLLFAGDGKPEEGGLQSLS